MFIDRIFAGCVAKYDYDPELMCMYIFQRKVNLHATDNDGHTALSLAVKHRHDR